MLTRRIIPCLDVRDGAVVKGVRFGEHRVVGAIEELAQRYRDEGADELVLYDITASPERRRVDVAWVERVTAILDIPFCVAGGIADIHAARSVFAAGADKVSINSPALVRPALIDELAREFGSQCVVVGIDSSWRAGAWRTHQLTGDASLGGESGRDMLDWLAEAQDRGAGEIVLNCMGSDGVRNGYDIEQLQVARARCRVPLIASGGAGAVEHFADVFEQCDVDGTLAASVFHSGAIAIPDLKRALAARGIPMRPAETRPTPAVFPASSPVIPATSSVISATSPVIPAQAGIHSDFSRSRA